MRISTAATMFMAVTAVTVLAGCAAGPAPAPSTTSEPSPSSTVEPIIEPSAPTLRYSLTCDQFVPDNLLAITFGADAVAPVKVPATTLTPRGASIRVHGGLTCEWGNDELQNTASGISNPAYKNLTLHLIPDTDGKWDEYVETGYLADPVDQQFGSESSTACFVIQAEFSDSGLCSTNVLLGSNWAELLFHGIDVPRGSTSDQLTEKMRPVIEGIVERVPDPRPVTDIAPDVTMKPCEETLRVDQVLDVLNLPPDTLAKHTYYGGGGYSLTTAAAEYSSLQECMVTPGTDLRFVGTKTLPGGAWAFTAPEVVNGLGYEAETVQIPGTSADSYVRCTVTGVTLCTLHMAVGDDWVAVELYDDMVESSREQLLALGALVAANLD